MWIREITYRPCGGTPASPRGVRRDEQSFCAIPFLCADKVWVAPRRSYILPFPTSPNKDVHELAHNALRAAQQTPAKGVVLFDVCRAMAAGSALSLAMAGWVNLHLSSTLPAWPTYIGALLAGVGCGAWQGATWHRLLRHDRCVQQMAEACLQGATCGTAEVAALDRLIKEQPRALQLLWGQLRPPRNA